MISDVDIAFEIQLISEHRFNIKKHGINYLIELLKIDI